MKPRDDTALNELANAYAGRVAQLQGQIQSPPTPPLAALGNVKAFPSDTVLGTALDSLLPTELNITSLQQGESAQLQKQLDKVIKQHVGVYERSGADARRLDGLPHRGGRAGKDGNVPLQISLYRQFLKKYPSDPLVPDIKNQITKLRSSSSRRDVRLDRSDGLVRPDWLDSRACAASSRSGPAKPHAPGRSSGGRGRRRRGRVRHRRPRERRRVAHGKQVFSQTCASCHTLAAAGTSGTIGPNLDDAFCAVREQGFK